MAGPCILYACLTTYNYIQTSRHLCCWSYFLHEMNKWHLIKQAKHQTKSQFKIKAWKFVLSQLYSIMAGLRCTLHIECIWPKTAKIQDIKQTKTVPAASKHLICYCLLFSPLKLNKNKNIDFILHWSDNALLWLAVCC